MVWHYFVQVSDSPAFSYGSTEIHRCTGETASLALFFLNSLALSDLMKTFDAEKNP